MAKEVVSGSGTRYGAWFLLDAATGLPMPAAASSVMYEGIEIQGIKSTKANDPAPRPVNHMGNDEAYAQDSLPPVTVETYQFVSSKVNFDLDTAIEGALTRAYTQFNARAANTNNLGNEPLGMTYFYRQALDTDEGSGTFGSLRQWNVRIYPSGRTRVITPDYAEAETDITYEGTPTKTEYTPWNEDINTTNWGAKRASHLEGITDYQPIIGTARGNGTITAYSITKPPVDSSSILVWVDGTLVTPSAVNTSTANPAFTLSSPPANDKLVFALIQTTVS